MAMGSFNHPGANAPTAEINMTPLVDVMLVLLIIFIITAPLMTHAVQVNLPRANSTAVDQQKERIQLAINAEGVIHVDNEVVTLEALPAHLQALAAKHAELEMHFSVDKMSRYDTLAQAMSIAQRAGINRLAFVTNPQ